MGELLRLLREFADADVARSMPDEDLQTLIGRVEQFTATAADGDDAPTVGEIPDEDLDALVEGIRALADEEFASAAMLREALTVHETAAAEQGRREEEAAAEEAERQAAIAALRGDPDAHADADDPDPDSDPDPGDNDSDEGDSDDGDGSDENDDTPAATDQPDQEPEPVTAAAPARAVRRTSRRALNQRRPRNADPAPPPDPGVRILFGADIPGVPTGAEADFPAVNRAMLGRYRTFARQRARGGSEQRIPVATVQREFPAERTLLDSRGRMLAAHEAAARVQQVINEALAAYRGQGQQALTAAGGLCAPLQPIYDVPMLGEQSRPIRDGALMSFQTARGGVVSVTPPTLAQLDAQNPNAVGVWTVADDEAATGDGDVKSCARIECGDPRETEIYAITKCLIVGNFIARTFSEYTDAWAELAMVHQDRTAEARLFALIRGSVITTQHSVHANVLSATRDVLTFLDQVAWNLRTRHRLGRNFPFRVILPEILHGVMRTDIARALPGGSYAENLNVADAALAQFFASRNLNVTWSPDLVIQAAPAAGAEFPDWPDTIPYALYPEGTFLHLDAGELDLGVVRDSSLNELNDFEIFAESFEAVHPLGVEAIAGDIQVCATGHTAGTVDLSELCGPVS